MRTSLKRYAIPTSVIVALGGGAFAATAVAQNAVTTAIPVGTSDAVAKVLPLQAADMLGANEIPTTGAAAPASGSAIVTVDKVTNEVCVNLATTGISAFTGLHIHSGITGASGPVVVPFAPATGTTNSYSACVTDTDAASIAANPSAFYLNVHTAEYPDGALRDQLSIRSSETQMLATPQRAYDSRNNADGVISKSAERVIDLSKFGVPIGARAAVINLTATTSTGTGYLVAYSNALTTVPATSTVNFFPTADVANETTVAVDGAGKIKVAVGPVGSTNFIVDVVGYVL
jgi:hypothetical protein